MYTHIYLHMYVCICIYIHIQGPYMHVCIRTYIYIYICKDPIYTDIKKDTFSHAREPVLATIPVLLCIYIC